MEMFLRYSLRLPPFPPPPRKKREERRKKSYIFISKLSQGKKTQITIPLQILSFILSFLIYVKIRFVRHLEILLQQYFLMQNLWN